MDERAERVGRNEALFRAVNERVERLNTSMAVLTDTFAIVCECGDGGCIAQLRVSPREYERIRSDSALFFVLPGHQIEDVEDVVEQAQGYVVVRKHSGDPEQLAEATDPRRD